MQLKCEMNVQLQRPRPHAVDPFFHQPVTSKYYFIFNHPHSMKGEIGA